MQSAPPLTPEQLRSLVDTAKRARKIRRASAVARFGGWTGAIFAGLTILGSVVWWSWSGLFVGVGLAAVAYGEFHGAALLSRLDPSGPRRLALNQGLLAAVLCVYAVWCLFQPTSKELQTALASSPEFADLAESIEQITHLLVYGTLLVVGIVAPGLTAMYYLSRERLIRELRDSAPPSVIEAVKAA
jgi:hypothetical protein